MKIIACIPVTQDRHSIVPYTIKRLIMKLGIHVICGGGEESRKICEDSSAEFIEVPNSPLGRKWNQIVLKAKEHNPDAILILGCNQWISDNYIDYMSPFLEDNQMVGRRQFNILNFGDKLEMVRWLYYPREKYRFWFRLMSEGKRNFIKAGGRHTEPVGLGRLLRKDFLDAIDWKPYEDSAHSGLDSIMMKKLSSVQGSYAIDDSQHVQSLKITSDKWDNLNSFEKYKEMKSVKEILTPIEFLMVWFPDALQLEL